jgi:nitronate monooxygenase
MLDLRYPIIQGPFGGGLSSVALVSAVSNAGGLGSFGAHHLQPGEIASLATQLRAATKSSFAINLWVSTHDVAEAEVTRERFAKAVDRLGPVYDELAVTPPHYPDRFAATFEEQVEAVIAAAPRAFSVVFGVPADGVLQACRERGIVTIGTAITPDEAVALDDAGVDVIVASGSEAGGHRGAFLADAEDSLIGTMALVRVVAEEVRAPVVAAGGIADARGIAAAFMLGAEGVQIGTAFLATAESGTTPEHRALLFSRAARHTRLTRAFSGRLARGIPNRPMSELAESGAIEPYPYQGYLLKPIIDAARSQGRTDLYSLWSGQAAPLLRHHHAGELFEGLVDGVDQLLAGEANRVEMPTPEGQRFIVSIPSRQQKGVAMASAVQQFSGAYSADPAHSSFQVSLRHMGVGSFRTGFDDVEARLGSTADGYRLVGRARADSIAIKHPPEFRAHVVESSEFLDAGNHPYISFESTKLRIHDDGNVELEGTLTIKGMEKSIHATGTYRPPIEDIYGNQRAAIDLVSTIDRRDWEMNYQGQLPNGDDVLSWDVDISVHLELVADAA